MNEKSVLRKQIRESTKKLPLSYRIKAGEIIGEKLVSSPEFIRARSIFIYLSTPFEPETRYIIKKALEEGKKVYVPVCISKGIMKAAEIQKNTLFVKGYMGISEPSEQAEYYENSFDLAVIPCLTASADGKRLGHGGGFYDIFLQKHKCPAICLCFGRLLTDDIPMEPHDKKADKVLTD